MAAFVALYDSTAPQVYGLALRILGDRHQSEEVTQEVFLEVWQTCTRFDPARGSARTWLMTIAHHTAVDRVRRTEAWRRRDTAHAANSGTTPYDETATGAASSLEAQVVRSALATLSPTQRQALELTYFGGYTHQQVSGLMRAPLGTTKSRIRDGLIRLRDALPSLAAEPA